MAYGLWLLPLWAAFVLWRYLATRSLQWEALHSFPGLDQVTWEVGARHAKAVFGVVLFGGLNLLVGRSALKRFVGEDDREGWIPLSFGLGAGILGTIYFILVLSHQTSSASVLIVAALLLGWGVFDNREVFRRQAISHNRRLDSLAATAIPGGLIVSALILSGAQALTSETFYDALVYHLALPSLYKLSGGFVATPECLYSGIPMLTEMLFSWTLYLNPNSLGPMISWAAFAFSACCIVSIGKRVHSAQAGLWAAAIFLTTPFVTDAAHRSGVEGASTLWLLCAICVLLRKDSDNQDSKPYVLAGAFMGFAMSAKYTNWPLTIVVCAGLLATGASRRNVAKLAFTAFAVVSPWVLKNLMVYGNPIFPFADDLINLSDRVPVDWRALHADAQGRDWGEILSSGKEIGRVLLHPWLMTMGGRYDHNTIGAAFLMLLPLILSSRGESRQMRFLSLTALGAWLSWWPFSGLPRFFIPGLSLLSLVFSISALSLSSRLRHIVLASVCVACLFNYADSTAFAFGYGGFRELAGNETPEDNLRRGRPTYPAPNFGALEWINRNTPQSSKVLVIGDGRTFYLRRRFVPNSSIDRPVFFSHLGASRSVAELSDSLRARGLTHLAVNMSLLARTSPPKGTADGVAGDVLEEFLLRYADLVFEERDLPTERWNLVYELRTEPLAKPLRGSDIFVTWFRRPRPS